MTVQMARPVQAKMAHSNGLESKPHFLAMEENHET